MNSGLEFAVYGEGAALAFPVLCCLKLQNSPGIAIIFKTLSFAESLPLKRTDADLGLLPIPRKEIKDLDTKRAHSATCGGGLGL